MNGEKNGGVLHEVKGLPLQVLVFKESGRSVAFDRIPLTTNDISRFIDPSGYFNLDVVIKGTDFYSQGTLLISPRGILDFLPDRGKFVIDPQVLSGEKGESSALISVINGSTLLGLKIPENARLETSLFNQGNISLGQGEFLIYEERTVDREMMKTLLTILASPITVANSGDDLAK